MKRLLRVLILLLVRLVGFPAASAATRKAFSAAPRVLLLRPDHLGDLVLTTPVLDALKTYAPDVHITLMVGPWSSEVVARHPAIDRLITYPFPGFRRATQGVLEPYIQLFQTAQQLHRGKYDVAINLRPDFWWGAALLYLAAIPRRIGYAIQPGTTFLTHAECFQASEHATVSNLRLISTGLRVLGKTPLDEPYTPERFPLVFHPTQDEQNWVSQRLHHAKIGMDVPLVVIHAGTGATVKLWRTEAWTSTANTLITTFSAHIVLTGSASERLMLEEIAQGITLMPLLLTDATVGQLAALLKRATIVLGVDNGPLHLAVAQGTPTLQIFGPTDSHIFGPWGPSQQHIVLAATHRCPSCPTIPCGRLDFRLDELPDHPCVRLVSELQVQADSISLMRSYGITRNTLEDKTV
ncbi:MAG: glycosyltransferase family 9 protein [Ktedonobacteraceae bacterium]